MSIRAGDTVRHRPTGEVWTVAAIRGDELAWAGWPPGVAKTSDCELMQPCKDDTHVYFATHEWPVGDYRRSLARWHSCPACEQAKAVQP